MSKLEYSEELVGIVKQAFEEMKIRYTVEDDCVFRFSGAIKSVIRKLNYTIIVDEDSVGIFASCPISADPSDKDMMARVSEFICRANYSISCGVAFQLDYRDGEISARDYIECGERGECGECLPNTQVIINQIGITATSFKKYANGFFTVIAGGSAEKAFIKCENSFRDILKKLLEDVADEDEIDEFLEDIDDFDNDDDNVDSSDSDDGNTDIDKYLEDIDDDSNDSNDSNDSASDNNKPVFRTDLFGDNQ